MSSVNSSKTVVAIRVDSVVGAERAACVHELVAQQAAENPNALAVSSGHEDLVVCRTRPPRQPSGELSSLGRCRRNVVVGLYLDRSPFMVVAALAILKAGGAYVPLDPIHPVERLAFMLRDAGARHRSDRCAPEQGISVWCRGEWFRSMATRRKLQPSRTLLCNPALVLTIGLHHLHLRIDRTAEGRGIGACRSVESGWPGTGGRFR